MTRTAEGVRLAGDLISVFAAWYRSPVGIAAGLLLVLAAWSYGLLPVSKHKSEQTGYCTPGTKYSIPA
jgi:hypothetical protein